jgi:hypothetical protein
MQWLEKSAPTPVMAAGRFAFSARHRSGKAKTPIPCKSPVDRLYLQGRQNLT